MATAADLAIAQSALDAEASVIQTLVAQVAGGDASSKDTLAGEYTTAQQMLQTYQAQVPTVDPSLLNTALAQAGVVLGGQLPAVTTAGGAPAMVSKSGLRLGSIVVPWSVVAAVVLFGLTVWYVSKKKRRTA